MRHRVVAEFFLVSACSLGAWGALHAQEGPRPPRGAEHRVSVVVPVIFTLLPPEAGSADQGWRVRTNDPNLRKRLSIPTQRAGDTIQVTLTTP